ncbi:MAG TPA: cell division protein ZapA [Novosphingobium sp.]|nr:cell division protein ZapA [Novosphingobium sp.]
MSNVTLTIAGRDYAVACAEGEEAHVTRLGAMIDSKLEAMGGTTTQGETRTLLFAALLLADELHELKSGAAPAFAPASGPAPDHADALERIAARLESCASALEG